MSRFCGNCGEEYPDDSIQYCPSCGTTVDHRVTILDASDVADPHDIQMNMKESVKSVLTKYAKFDGRASRSEYWWFELAFWIVLVISSLVPILGPLALVVVLLGSIIPRLAVSSRRLHDSNKSGWYQLFGLVPLIGPIGLIVLFALPSDKGENKYGSL